MAVEVELWGFAIILFVFLLHFLSVEDGGVAGSYIQKSCLHFRAKRALLFFSLAKNKCIMFFSVAS